MKPKEGQALAWVGEQDKWVKNGWADIPSQGYDKPFDLAFPKEQTCRSAIAGVRAAFSSLLWLVGDVQSRPPLS
jgi:hypothetical protein